MLGAWVVEAEICCTQEVPSIYDVSMPGEQAKTRHHSMKIIDISASMLGFINYIHTLVLFAFRDANHKQQIHVHASSIVCSVIPFVSFFMCVFYSSLVTPSLFMAGCNRHPQSYPSPWCKSWHRSPGKGMRP